MARNTHDSLSNFLAECQKNVNAIEKYSGVDPLAVWYQYLLWIDEHFVIDFKQETIFDLILSACLCKFEGDERYKQDRRLIKLFIKFIHFQEEQDMHYEAMFSNGIGSKVADLYINWAFYFDMKGEFKKADQIYRRGISAGAEPLDLLETAHQNFGYSVSQRMLYKSNETFQREQTERMQKQLKEITALHIDAMNSKTVKSMALLSFDKEKLANSCIPFCNAAQSTTEPQPNSSVAQNIMDSARKMRREKRSNVNVTACRLDFNANSSDKIPKSPEPNKYENGIRVGKNYPRKSLPQRQIQARAYVDPEIGTYRKEMPAYDKILLVPATNVAFSPDELKAYNWFKQKGIENAFTHEQDKIWGVGHDVPIRYADVFARKNFPQSEWNVPRISSSEYLNENGPHRFMCNMVEMYPKHVDEEFQLEEIMWQKRKVTAQQATKQAQANKSVLRASRIQNRTNSTDSKLSPIVEMDLSTHDDTLTAAPIRRRESIHLNTNHKKRKSSIFPVFDALNDTCTTQMFSNLLHSSAFSTPKIKMPKFNEDSTCENLPEETKLKLFIDQSTTDSLSKENLAQKDGKRNNVVLNPTNEFKFTIYEDTTALSRELRELANKDGDTFSGNKENVFVAGNQAHLEGSKSLAAQNKTENRAIEPIAAATNVQRKEETIAKVAKSEMQDPNNGTQQPSAFAFDIYTDKTNENLQKALENSRKIMECAQLSTSNKENRPNEKGVAQLNEMIASLLNATKSVDKCKDQSVFKEPSVVNLSIKKTEVAKQSNQTTFFELLDTTEEFEALEAQCANSPPVSGLSNTPIKGINNSRANIRTPNKSIGNKPIDKALLNLTRQRSMMTSKEPPIVEHVENKNEENANQDTVDEHIGQSIYVKQPELEFNERDADWHEVTQFLADANATNEYKVEEINLDETRQRIDTHMLNMKDLNPFEPEVQKDVLNDIGFLDQLNGANNFNCAMMNIVHPLKPKSSFEFNERKYQIRKLIGTGAYGKVFFAECSKTKEMLALKQQRPPNLWEYYVCLQIHTRITDENIRKGFMAVDFAVIGNNSTIFASKFSKYGTILNICNKVKQATNKNIEECIVMILVKQMFTIMEHFHKAKFIHADIKPDNFLLMDKLSLNYENPEIVMQLIDFGQSIDLSYFSNHVFWAKVKTENFICTEMMEDKPWTYHCDFFCLASTIYTMVAGKYMVVSRRKPTEPYKPQKLPRYVNATLWDEIFDTLINIPSLRKMPSLSRLQDLLDVELRAIGPKKITDAINKFNKALES